MSNFRALQIASLSPDLQRRIAESVDFVVLNDQADRDAYLQRNGSDFDIVITTGGKGCSAKLMQQLPNLKLILGLGVGYDKVDMKAARERRVQVANTPDVLNECVADMAMAMILCQARYLIESAKVLASGQWRQRGATLLGHKVSGKRLGILGLGRIGLELAQRAQSFRMDVRYHNRNPRADLPFGYEPNLLALARWCDYLVVLCPGGAQTEKLIDAPVMQALGPKGVLVNIARGSVVDEKALIVALTSGDLGGAALDVFENEPNFPEALLDLPNVVMFPHIGSSTYETREAMSQLLIDNLNAFVQHNRLVTPVT